MLRSRIVEAKLDEDVLGQADLGQSNSEERHFDLRLAIEGIKKRLLIATGSQGLEN